MWLLNLYKKIISIVEGKEYNTEEQTKRQLNRIKKKLNRRWAKSESLFILYFICINE